jgi:type IV pilus assembly protein PilX
MAIGSIHPKQRQSGAILFVSIILLVVLTMLGFAALRTATMQERMAGNVRDRGIAFQAAESALRGAQKYIGAGVSGNAATFNNTTCTDGIFKVDANDVPYFVNQGNSTTGGVKWDGNNPDFWNEWPWEDDNCFMTESIVFVDATDYGKPGKPIQTPRYVIEELPKDINGNTVYRVTARGYGSSKSAVVDLQATFVVN